MRPKVEQDILGKNNDVYEKKKNKTNKIKF